MEPENKEKKDLQKVQYDNANSCIAEIKHILDQVKAKFNAAWNAEKQAEKAAGSVAAFQS
jgi:hypothetical protein